MTDITTRLLNMSEAMYMDRSQDELDALLLEAKGEIERLRIDLAAKETEALGYLRAVGTLQRRVEELEGIGSAHDLISDWLGEGVEDLPDDTPVNVHIGARSIIHNKLGELRAALIPQQKGNADAKQ